MLEKLNVFGMTLAIVNVRVKYYGSKPIKKYPESCERFIGQPGVEFLPATEDDFNKAYELKFGKMCCHG